MRKEYEEKCLKKVACYVKVMLVVDVLRIKEARVRSSGGVRM